MQVRFQRIVMGRNEKILTMHVETATVFPQRLPITKISNDGSKT
jgi:hypothetical protein